MTHILVLLSCASFLGLLPVTLLAERLSSSRFFHSAGGIFSRAPPTASAACGDLQGIWENRLRCFEGREHLLSEQGRRPRRERGLPELERLCSSQRTKPACLRVDLRRLQCAGICDLGILRANREYRPPPPLRPRGHELPHRHSWLPGSQGAFGCGSSRRQRQRRHCRSAAGPALGSGEHPCLWRRCQARGHYRTKLWWHANITMDRATKEAQDAKMIVPRTPCANVSQSALLDCLFTVDAGLLDAALDPSYSLFDALYDYPTNHEGLRTRMSALVFVDGTTITSPLLDALETGLHDVPLIMQSAQAELAVSPAPELENISRKNLSSFLHRKFDPTYGRNTTEEIWKFYEHYQPPEYATYALDSDTGMACGLRRLAMAARSGFRQPVYWTTVTGAPSGSMPQIRQMPFHNWDFLAAVGNFANYGYTPSPRDEAFGERLLDDWFQLLSNGSLTEERGYRKVQDMQGQNVIGSTVGSTKTDWHFNHKMEVCTFWESIGVDQRWWWIN
ncbi:pnbA [Symbiodinium sp. CCMP2456]|nr:pnbA [Symbiodinium sp. CCMP2456]